MKYNLVEPLAEESKIQLAFHVCQLPMTCPINIAELLRYKYIVLRGLGLHREK